MVETTITAVCNRTFPDSAIRADAVRSLQALITQELDRMATMHETGRTSCPRCGSPRHTKRGHDSLRRQRFLCSECGRSYTAHSGNAFAGAKLSRETWMQFAACHAGALSLRKAAAQCGICLKTAFLMRKRILSLLTRQASIRSLLAQKGLPRILPITRDCNRDPARPYTVAHRAGFDATAAENAIAKCIVIASAAELHRALRWRGASRNRITRDAPPLDSAHAAICAFMRRFRRVEEHNLPGYHAWFEWIIAISMHDFARSEARAAICAIAHQGHNRPQAASLDLQLAAMRCTEQLQARWRLAIP